MNGRTFYAGHVDDIDVSCQDGIIRLDDLANRFREIRIPPDKAEALADILKTAAQAARAQTPPGKQVR